jgi:hypothetical protein
MKQPEDNRLKVSALLLQQKLEAVAIKHRPTESHYHIVLYWKEGRQPSDRVIEEALKEFPQWLTDYDMPPTVSRDMTRTMGYRVTMKGFTVYYSGTWSKGVFTPD